MATKNRASKNSMQIDLPQVMAPPPLPQKKILEVEVAALGNFYRVHLKTFCARVLSTSLQTERGCEDSPSLRVLRKNTKTVRVKSSLEQTKPLNQGEKWYQSACTSTAPISHRLSWPRDREIRSAV
jgi:hypothetical protein